jgi:hypothetical protein
MSEDELKTLYSKLQLPLRLVEQDYRRNQLLLQHCYELGKRQFV